MIMALKSHLRASFETYTSRQMEDIGQSDSLSEASNSASNAIKHVLTASRDERGKTAKTREIREDEKDSTADNDVEAFYDFQLFAKQLQTPSAEPIIKYTKSFLRNFQTQRVLWTASEQTKLINDFKIFIYEKLLDYEPFKSLDATKLRNAEEGIEKLIMGKLYTKCFAPCLKNFASLDEEHKQDLIDDENLREKVNEFRFIIPIELDIPESLSDRVDSFVKFSGKELSKINQFKAPRDKMICVLNSCKVIFGILRHHKEEEKGADIFIPLLIYTILKNRIPALASNVKYIERFRYDDFIRGEASYYLNSLQAAINFIMTMESQSLTICQDGSFEERYEQNQETLLRESKVAASDDKNNESDHLENFGVSELPKKHKTPLPSDYILHPLDDAANAVMNKFNELFSNTKHESPEHQEAHAPTAGDRTSIAGNDDEMVSKLAKRLEEEERKNTLETLQAMFPEMDGGIIEDVCIAKKYRVGATVDVLLSF